MKESFLKWIVLTDQPFSLGENQYFRDFCVNLNSTIQFTPKAEIVRDKAIEKSVEIKATVIEMLKNQVVSITTDGWTSVANESYMSLTVHYINEDWELISMNLDCAQCLI